MVGILVWRMVMLLFWMLVYVVSLMLKLKVVRYIWLFEWYFLIVVKFGWMIEWVFGIFIGGMVFMF